jgi:hypothetical protein
MASKNGKSAEETAVLDWYKAWHEYEVARDAAAAAGKLVQSKAKAVFDAFGSAVLDIDGRPFRAIYKKERKNKAGEAIPESWAVLPVALNKPTQKFSSK